MRDAGIPHWADAVPLVPTSCSLRILPWFVFSPSGNPFPGIRPTSFSQAEDLGEALKSSRLPRCFQCEGSRLIVVLMTLALLGRKPPFFF